MYCRIVKASNTNKDRKGIDSIRRAAKRNSFTKMSETLIIAERLFDSIPSHRLIVCRRCRYTVWPHQIARHLSGREHRLRRREAKKIQDEISHWPDLIDSAESLAAVNDGVRPFEALRMYEDGKLCQVKPESCKYICRSVQAMKNHILRAHPDVRRNRRGRPSNEAIAEIRINPPVQQWKPAVCQRFFTQGPGSQYFAVAADEATATAAVPVTATRIEQAEQVMIQAMERVKDQRRRLIAEAPFNEPSLWLKRVGWVKRLEGLDRDELVSSVREPEPDTELIATLIWRAMDEMIRECQQTVIEYAGIFIRMEAIRTESKQTNYHPLQAYMNERAIRDYSRPWKQIIMFIERTQREHKWESPRYRLNRKQKSAWAELRRQAAEESVREMDRASETNSRPGSASTRSSGGSSVEFASQVGADRHGSGDDSGNRSDRRDDGRRPVFKKMRGLKKACLEFCIRLLDQKAQQNEYECALVYASAVLGAKSDGWKGVSEYPPILSALIKVARFMIVQYTFQLSKRVTSSSESSGSSNGEEEREARRRREKKSDSLDLLTRMMNKFMVRGSHGPMEWFLDTRTYGMSEHYRSTAEGHVEWRGEELIYKHVSFTVTQFRGMVHSLVAKTRRLLHEEIFDLREEERAPYLDMAALYDRPVEKMGGWNFIQDERNQWPVEGDLWLWRRLKRPESRYRLVQEHGGLWNQDEIRRIEEQIGEFKGKLMACVHFTGGAPARGPELLSIRHSNTAVGGYRNIFIEDGAVVTVTKYHKGYTGSGRTKVIQRYLPREVGRLMIYYLWLVAPLQRYIEVAVREQSVLSDHVWPPEKESGEWTSEPLRRVIERESGAGMGATLNIQSYREVAIAISRKYLMEGCEFERDEDDYEGSEADKNQAVDLQAGHSSGVAGAIYARRIDQRDGEVERMRQKFQTASEDWHELLGFESRAIRAGERRRRGRYVVDMDEACMARWKRVKRLDLDDELVVLMGEDKSFRGVQREALEAVVAGHKRIVVVMGTGGGKSLVFMLAAWMGRRRDERGGGAADRAAAGYAATVPGAGYQLRGVEQRATAGRGEDCAGDAGGGAGRRVWGVFGAAEADAAAGSDRD